MKYKIQDLREQAIKNQEATGLPFSDVCIRGIRSGQWDGGKLVKEAMKGKKNV